MPRGIYIRTEVYRQKQREAMARHKNPNKSFSLEVRKKIGDSQRGKPKSENFKQKLSVFYKGKPSFWKGQIASPETRAKMSIARSGDKHYNWKGGVTTEHTKIRTSAEYKAWRSAVFSRDGYKCTICGNSGRGVTLNADHIIPFAHLKEARFDLSNGRTLCVPCHKATPTYGGKYHSWERTA